MLEPLSVYELVLEPSLVLNLVLLSNPAMVLVISLVMMLEPVLLSKLLWISKPNLVMVLELMLVLESILFLHTAHSWTFMLTLFQHATLSIISRLLF